MPDKSKKFHEFALKSVLFKGRNDWYFCYLKAERIAHVVALLSEQPGVDNFKDTARGAASLPAEIVRMAAGELDIAQVLADVFALMSAVRIEGTRGTIDADNASVLVKEYEQVAERLVQGSHPSPFGGVEDFFVPELPEPQTPLSRFVELAPASEARIKDSIKDTDKGHPNGQPERAARIMDYLRKEHGMSGGGASIKDIAGVIRGCSEKTIQRELNELIRRGLVRRVGERRWSVYLPA
jgi:hypothetical protein